MGIRRTSDSGLAAGPHTVVSDKPQPKKGIAMAKLQLLRLLCINPATSFGDDIRIVVDGQDAGGEFGIDKGQTHDLSEFVFDVDEESANIVFFEDNDHAADF